MATASPQAKNNVASVLNTAKTAQTRAKEARDKADSVRRYRKHTETVSGERDGDSIFSRFGGLFKSSSDGDAAAASADLRRDLRRTKGDEPQTRYSLMTRSDLNARGRDQEAAYRRASARGSGRYDGDETDLIAASLNDIFTNKPVLVLLYAMKLMRVAVIAGALYLASKTIQARYVNSVFVNNENPPNLALFVLAYVVIEGIFMSLILFILFLLTKIVAPSTALPFTSDVISLFAFDYAVSTVIIALIGVMLAVVIMKKKYFRYRTDGLRAIRSLQEMILNVAFVAMLFPYFALNAS